MSNKTKIAIVGSGMGSLTAACLLAERGHEVCVFEQNYLPGGCTSSYYRQGFIFEAGATTVVGLDEDMPLKYLLDKTGIHIDAEQLHTPMQVHLSDGTVLTRHQDLNKWIAEAERAFGHSGQRSFWEYCHEISQFVWATSLRQKVFPPTSLRDLGPILQNFRPNQLKFALLAFKSVKDLLKQFGLLDNQRFVEFVDEQLLITAQNTHAQVNVLFGATALCYTNSANYYVHGGLIQLVKPLIAFIESKGGQVFLREGIHRVEQGQKGNYILHTSKQRAFSAEWLLSGLPLNNTLAMYPGCADRWFNKRALMESSQLNSAFQMGIGFGRAKPWQQEVEEGFCLHHQIHLPSPLPMVGSKSIFLSMSHPYDWFRAPLGQGVASISTHVPNPLANMDFDKSSTEQAIIQRLSETGLLPASQITYTHGATPATWAQWTQREHGFVGGYPQYMSIKPWEMHDARLDGKRAFICGDSVYPGQGIPGVCLSGIIAFEKMLLDGL